MQQWEAKPVDVDNVKIIPGDVLILPLNNVNLYRLRGLTFHPPEDVDYALPWLATMSAPSGAGFYSHFRGPLPWVFAHIPPERYEVLRVK
jgi:hypothetical protein